MSTNKKYTHVQVKRTFKTKLKIVAAVLGVSMQYLVQRGTEELMKQLLSEQQQQENE